MSSKVQKWGNSQGLRLSKQVLEDARITVGDDVEVIARKGRIVITPVKPTRKKKSLRQLVARIPKDYKPAEVDWGPPVGRESW